jgi:hypothetical protein
MKSTMETTQTEEQMPTAEQQLENIEAILSYDEGMDSGIGYRKGTLVEFNIPQSGPFKDRKAPIQINEITLRESLEWAEKMLYASERLDILPQMGPGLAAWFVALHSALPKDA